MFCAHCGTEIPDGGEFCPQCGCRAAPFEPAEVNAIDDSIDIKTYTVDNEPEEKRKGQASSMKKIAAAVIAAVLLVLVALLLVEQFGQPESQRGVHIPTTDEIEKQANSIEGGAVRFETNYGYEDSYFILIDSKPVGSLYLNVSARESIGIYIEKNKADDPDSAYAQICVGAIKACDPSLSLADAKEILSSALSGETKRNGVSYTTTLPKDRNILRISVPTSSD